jgi:predicted nucleic acid-binding Zn ribbon protein
MVKIRKCANPRCAKLIPASERPNKKYCSEDCKNKTNNDKNSKKNMNWDKILDRYSDLPNEPFIPFSKWLKESYYTPREIKQKKI